MKSNDVGHVIISNSHLPAPGDQYSVSPAFLIFAASRSSIFGSLDEHSSLSIRSVAPDLSNRLRFQPLCGGREESSPIGSTYFSYGLLFAFGQFRDFFRKIFDWWSSTTDLQGYASICLGLEDFYTRRLYLRIQDCFGRPISSAPDAWFDVVERTTKKSRCLNLGSYNYLGFAASDEYCTPRAIETLKRFSASTCSSQVDGGTTSLHNELEECVARFVGKPAAVVFGMGYATNSAILPVLIGKGGLIISDSLNHNSIVNGARGSGATIRVFQHNSEF
ncbi:hypothetical protein SAY87_026360 [Trapa incisa]|uniref:Aminotransferase class I/classII large domain-containing protein n=1 Tax=Trapa incisa TaxID=236973 RepID=A0AAN7JL05_9MYRT|nr:hypothetical protein SAY87_026360 [Trapa incisa]